MNNDVVRYVFKIYNDVFEVIVEVVWKLIVIFWVILVGEILEVVIGL